MRHSLVDRTWELGLVVVLGLAGPMIGADPAAKEAISADWWAEAQQKIAESEYHITWQDSISLQGLEASWQAPNRAQGFRTFFTGTTVRLAPRTEDGPSWELGLALLGFGRGSSWKEADEADLVPDQNRIDYERQDGVEWYVNSPTGLKHGFTLYTAPLSGEENAPLEIDLELSGGLLPKFSLDGQAIDFEHPTAGRVLRYAELRVTDATGQEVPSHMEGFRRGGVGGVRLVVDDRDAVYPLTVDPLLTGPAWTFDGNFTDAHFAGSVATAGDVNGDGYSDVIVGAALYDSGQADEGKVFVFHGSASGLDLVAPDWTEESNQAGAWFGYSIATAGDVNGDGYSDVIIGAPFYDAPFKPIDKVNAGRAYLFFGSSGGLGHTATVKTGPNENDRFGFSVGNGGNVNCDDYSDIVVGSPGYDGNRGRAYVYYGAWDGLDSTYWVTQGSSTGAGYGGSVAVVGWAQGEHCGVVVIGEPYYDGGQTDEGRAVAFYGYTDGLPVAADWTEEIDQADAHFGISVAAAGDCDGDGYADLLVGADEYDGSSPDMGAVFWYRGSYFTISSVPLWRAEGTPGSLFGHSIGTAGDVNGDGFADIIVGAWKFDSGPTTEEGGAFLYLGSESGPDRNGTRPVGEWDNADWIGQGQQSYSHYGVSVGTAGDVNGDGLSDIIVGANLYDGGLVDEGRAFVYHGSTQSVVTDAVWNAQKNQVESLLGGTVASAGDVNGDGYSDVVIAADQFDNGQSNEGAIWVYHGSEIGLPVNHNWWAQGDLGSAYFGSSVAAAGDVDGDGFGDLIVGARQYVNSGNHGAAFVFHGSSTGLNLGGARSSGNPSNADWSLLSDSDWASLGESVASAGDVNGDGYGDVVVGASNYGSWNNRVGRVFVHHGSPTGLGSDTDWIAVGDQDESDFGYSVASAGDVNGDGFSDVIVGAPDYDPPGGLSHLQGRAFVYLGSTTGLDDDGARPEGSPANADWHADGVRVDARLGVSVASAGDVDGDGYSDVILGAPQDGDSGTGLAYVYHGSASGVQGAPWSQTRTWFEVAFGTSVASAGDVNGDGFGDIVVGDPHQDEGIARVYHGSPSGPVFAAQLEPEVPVNTDQFGASVASAGDINGDGFADVVVGAPYYGDTVFGEGIAFLYYGGGGDGFAVQPRQRRVDNSAPIGPLGASDQEDGFRVHFRALPPFGSGRVKLEWEVKPLGQPFDGTGTGLWASWQNSTQIGHEFQLVTPELVENTPYHWRVRVHYDPTRTPFQQRSRWYHVPMGGWNETDLRTPGCTDLDGDGFGAPASTWCPGGLALDCDDTHSHIYPGAPEICDAWNNDCLDPEYPTPPAGNEDLDGDSYLVCDGDCDDSDETVFPGAAQYCDGVNNDCDDPAYPAVPLDELDLDGDGMMTCEGDCNDANALIYYAAPEDCDGMDNNCNGTMDEDCDGVCDTPGILDQPQRLSVGSSTSEYPTVAWTGSGYGVAWDDYRHGNWEIYFALLDASGTMVPGSEVRVTDAALTSQWPDLVWTGTEFGLAWEDARDGNLEIYFARINASGSPIPGSETRVTNDAPDSKYPSLAWTGTGYGLAWEDNAIGSWEVLFALLHADGSFVGSIAQVSNSHPANAIAGDLVWTGSGFGLTWRDKQYGNWEIYFTTIATDGTPGSPERITNDAAYSASSALAWTGTEYGVVWNDTRDTEWEVYFARINASGSLVPGSVTRVTTEDAFHSWYPVIEWTGAEYGLAWRDDRDGIDSIYFARMNTTGGLLSSETRIVTPGQARFPAMAWNGTHFGLAWYEYRTELANWEVYFVQVDCCEDADGDGSSCYDCNDHSSTTYPGAPEVNDGIDNQCPGEAGSGLVDEISGQSGFNTPGNDSLYSWTAQAGASLYDVARSVHSDFSGDCTLFLDIADNYLNDTESPPAGQRFYYLVRAAAPFTGSWGEDAAGIERLGVCP